MNLEREYRKLKQGINISVGEKYKKFIESAIKSKPVDSDHNYIQLYKILHRFILPLQIFSWLVNSLHGVNVKLFDYVVRKKLEQDLLINRTVEALKGCGFTLISIAQLEPILNELVSCKNEYEKIFIYELLIGDSYALHSDRDIVYSIDNIRNNYPTIDFELGRGVYEAGFNGDHKLLNLILEQCKKHKITFIFDPKTNIEHSYLYSWIKDNVIKGCNNSMVGTRPDEDRDERYKMPSNNFEDYLYTLVILEKIVVKPSNT